MGRSNFEEILDQMVSNLTTDMNHKKEKQKKKILYKGTSNYQKPKKS